MAPPRTDTLTHMERTGPIHVVSTKHSGVLDMARGLGLWMLGVPISVIILIALFTNFI